MEEFAAADYNGTSSRVNSKDMQDQIQAIEAAGLPWMFWQIMKPEFGPNAYEVWKNELSWNIIAREARTSTYKQSYNWPELD